MAGGLRGAALALALLGLAPAVMAQALSMSAYKTYCTVDKDNPAADRTNPERVALALVRNMTDGFFDGVYRAMSQEARAAYSLEDIAKFGQTIKTMGPYQDIRAAHTYFIELEGSGPSPLPVICGTSLLDPDRVTLSVKAVPKQFYVEVTARSRNNDWSSFIWLEPEAGTLKVRSISFNQSAISGRTSRDLHALAVAQGAHGNALAAALLYRAAVGTAERGPNASPIWKQDLDKELAAYRWPSELAGPPPHRWKLDGRIFDVENADIIGIEGAMTLIFDRQLDTWPGDEGADADNRKFITPLVQAHPEFGESFKAIIAKAHKPDRSGGFSTAYEFAKGFD